MKRRKSKNKQLVIKLFREDGKECSYRGYKRQSVIQNNGDWKVKNNILSNREEIIFPLCGGSDETISYVSFAYLESPENDLNKHRLNNKSYVSAGAQPFFKKGQLTWKQTN